MILESDPSRDNTFIRSRMEFSGWDLQELGELADISRSKPKLMTLDLWSEIGDHSYSDANVFCCNLRMLLHMNICWDMLEGTKMHV
jgi:hypothetical protein